MTETIRVALSGLAANKLRSGLTILGLTIGVGSVIVLIAVGTGSSAAVQSQIDALGSNVLTVTSTGALGGFGAASAGTGSLTVADAAALTGAFTAPDVSSSAPVVNAASVTMTYDGTTYSPSSFVGTTPDYRSARDYSIAEGAWFTNAEERAHNRVLVVGPTVVTELFGGVDPVGDTVQVNGTNFTIVGVTNEKGADGSTNEDDVGIAPLTAVQDTLTGYGSISSIVVQARSRQVLSPAQTEITDILERRHPLVDGAGELVDGPLDAAAGHAAGDLTLGGDRHGRPGLTRRAAEGTHHGGQAEHLARVPPVGDRVQDVSRRASPRLFRRYVATTRRTLGIR